MKIIHLIAVFTGLCQRFISIHTESCGSLLPIYGMSLRWHVFQTLKVPNSLHCLKACNNDIRCQSINHVMGKDICELNNRTKEARPEDFVPDSKMMYVKRVHNRVPLGSISQLSAKSCKEIKSSETGPLVSGYYWFDIIRRGEGVLAFCDMETEDIDECSASIPVCDVNADCTNTIGSYNCACKPGYEGDGKTSCIAAECQNYQSLTSANRKNTFHTIIVRCDSGLGPGWFRFQGDAGTKMPTSCVPAGRCDTHAPGWLNGAHPSVADGKVTRQVCFTYFSNCCIWSINIQLRNCGDYFVYYISGTPPEHTCSLRFCGAD